MKCSKPYQIGVNSCGCGQCLACRINRRRIWTNRIMLESWNTKDNVFVTLTYNKENIPSDGSLDRKDFKLFLKNIRNKVRPRKIRYYGVGEYGDKSWRPHYHVILFGYPDCRYGSSDICVKKINGGCDRCKVIRSVWKKGHVFLGSCSMQSAQYVAGYVTKFSGKKRDIRLGKRIPEFSVMSLKPGIGAIALDSIADVVRRGIDKGLIDEKKLPTAIGVDGKEWPLGRYLSKKLRVKLGKGEKTPEEVIEEVGWKMRFVLEENIKRKGWPKAGDLSSIVARINEQQNRSLEKKEEIFKSRRIL